MCETNYILQTSIHVTLQECTYKPQHSHIILAKQYHARKQKEQSSKYEKIPHPSHMTKKFLIISLTICLLLLSGTVAGEETDKETQKDLPLENNATEGEEEQTLEELMNNRDWSKVAELMNKDRAQVQTRPSSVESSIKPAAANERWDSWFAPKEEEGFIIIPCGG